MGKVNARRSMGGAVLDPILEQSSTYNLELHLYDNPGCKSEPTQVLRQSLQNDRHFSRGASPASLHVGRNS
eukprot:CAMPEP_0175901884 /NCGR_PEP_ID=MMETSP0108-20121206/3099_1 /TAXON_ID=195067 ORGANISM="Goniomonas pacifica, Strain CCMP1869" /NCGR_SAMPLE_ID=MMETSP0108 /ASSEMBLY_ACC=CAM_ASM_000204 /LENGTH=70 /DNA_ID=CAMNT_0017223495 /DNA_START=30 /DNA_END=242 /DNA_ORIENTATION=-